MIITLIIVGGIVMITAIETIGSIATRKQRIKETELKIKLIEFMKEQPPSKSK